MEILCHMIPLNGYFSDMSSLAMYVDSVEPLGPHIRSE